MKVIASLLVIVIVSSMITVGANGYSVPTWLKNNAKWWSEGEITDDEFTSSVQYLMQKGVVQIPAQNNSTTSSNIPGWVKSDAGMWATGEKSEDDFINGMKYMVENGIIHSENEDQNQSESENDNVNKITSNSQIVLSDKQLAAMAGNKYSDGNVILGDGKYITTGAKKGFVYLCNVPPNGSGAQANGHWIHGSTWNFLEKLSVGGSVSWSNALFTNTVSGNARTLSGNGLPVGNNTGVFPISSSDSVSAYDRNPNSISAQSFSDKLPANPEYSDTPHCMGMEVGVMLNGVPINNAFDAALRDAPAHEAQDSCGGHPQEKGIYHYHNLSSCFKDADVNTVIGYALDGFPITGPKVGDKYLTTDDLDECHGITSTVIEDGVPTTTYHYVMTYDFPYSASCFRGEPSQYFVIGNGHGNSGQNGPNQNGPNQNGPNQNGPNQNGPNQNGPNQNGPNQGGPPQEAIDACNGKYSGDSCSFTSPRGDNISGVCRVPPSSSLACVPNNHP